MKTVEYQCPIVVYNPEELIEICKVAGAAASTIIFPTGKVVVFYRDPQTSGIQNADFVDELHIRHRRNARLLIAVFPNQDN